MSAVDAVNVRTHAPLPTRAQQIAALQSTEFDVLVIGGGATGKASPQLVLILKVRLKYQRRYFLMLTVGLIVF